MPEDSSLYGPRTPPENGKPTPAQEDPMPQGPDRKAGSSGVTAPGLLLLIGAAFTSGIVQPVIQQNFNPTLTTIGGLIAVLCFVGAFKWRKPSLHPSALRASAEKVASDFRWWLAIGGALWLYTCVMNALVEIRRNNEIVQLRNDVQSTAKVIDRLVLPRHLTRGQQRTISGFLLQFGPQEFAFKLLSR